jgi:hypothetical protein
MCWNKCVKSDKAWLPTSCSDVEGWNLVGHANGRKSTEEHGFRAWHLNISQRTKQKDEDVWITSFIVLFICSQLQHTFLKLLSNRHCSDMFRHLPCRNTSLPYLEWRQGRYVHNEELLPRASHSYIAWMSMDALNEHPCCLFFINHILFTRLSNTNRLIKHGNLKIRYL